MRALLVALLAVAFALPAEAGRKADRRLLERLKRVDGPGSGLDADTVRGRAPEDMAPGDTSGLAARIAALEQRLAAGTTVPPAPGGGGVGRDAFYDRSSRSVTTSGDEKLVRVSCNDANDVGVGCAGGVYDGSVLFPITWVGIVIGDGTTKPDSCLVVVDGRAGAPNMEATARCLTVP
jgi:hypothetical protein